MARPEFKNLKLSVEAGIATVMVSRPKALNALNSETLTELGTVFEYLEGCAPGAHGPESVYAIIFTGEGEKSFIAGADILEMKDKSPEAGEEFARKGQAVTRRMELLCQPVIAAVNGFALGGGCEFAMACDFILAAENAIFGQPEVALGIMPGFGGCVRLPKFVGQARAKELIFSGRKIKAAEAKEIGLALEVLPQDKLLPRAREIAESIGANSPLAVGRSKRAIEQVRHQSTDDGLREEALLFGALFGSHDQREGMAAFAEKRKADFNGE